MADTKSTGKTVDLFAKPAPKSDGGTSASFTPVESSEADLLAKAKANKVAADDALDPSMANLVNEARKRNAAMDEKFPDAHVAQVLRNNSDKVLQILKDHGMDSQQAEKAHKLLLALQ